MNKVLVIKKSKPLNPLKIGYILGLLNHQSCSLSLVALVDLISAISDHSEALLCGILVDKATPRLEGLSSSWSRRLLLESEEMVKHHLVVSELLRNFSWLTFLS